MVIKSIPCGDDLFSGLFCNIRPYINDIILMMATNNDENIEKIDNEPKKDKTPSLVNIYRVLKLVWQHDKKYLITEIFLSILSASLPILMGWYAALFINKITAGNLTTLFDPSLIWVVFMYLAIPFFIELSEVWYQYLYARFFISFDQYIDWLFIGKKSEIDIQNYENPEINNLILRVNENKEKILTFADWFLYIFGKFITLVITASVLFNYIWWVLPFLIIAILPDLIVQIKFGDKAWGIWDAKGQVKRRYRLLMTYFSEVSSLIEIKIFKNENYFRKIINNLFTEFNSEINANEKRRFRYKNFTVLIEVLAGAFVVFYIMNGVISKAIAVGTAIFLFERMNDVRDSLNGLFRGITVLGAENNFINDFFKLLNLKKVIKSGSVSIKKETPSLEFNNVSFAYPNTKNNVLNNFNFKINAGEKIAIVGVNGAGKTTLTKLIMRFYDVTEGSIKIDDNDIKDIDLSDYYSRIGHLSQNYAHYKLPVKEVIALGNTDVPMDIERVIESAKRSGAHDFISEWEHGYDTHLGKEFEEGVEPSVGQWQKLALARMFYKNPQIWILDEPTASIDAVAEMSIFSELENLPKDKTVILISHRFNTVKNADKIMVVEDGQIKEFDSHKNLMKIQDGIYRNLFELQKKSYEVKK